MTPDIPAQFADVPRLPNGRPDYRTKRGKELKAYMDAQTPPQAPQEPAEAETAPEPAVAAPQTPVASPVPALGTPAAGALVLEFIAQTWPEAKYTAWRQAINSMIHAGRNINVWRKLTAGR